MTNSKKILFFDIDGTLLPSNPYTVPDSAKKALKKSQENGHLTFINTGRTFSMLPQELLELGFDGYVCGCGSQIYMHGELLHSSTLSHEMSVKVVEMMRQCKVSAFLEQHHRLLYDSKTDYGTKDTEKLKSLFELTDLNSFSEEEAASYTLAKALILIHDFSDQETFEKFCEDNFVCFKHTSRAWEITQKEYSKATGIEFLLNHLGLSVDDSYAFGDSVNDLSMLKYAGTSVAMGNSMKEILPYCDYQTADILEDGIYKALEHFELI